VPELDGDLWLANKAGLFYSNDSAATFKKVEAVQEGYAIGFGKAAPGRNYPAIFLAGKVNGVQALYRSDDKAATWVRINDDQHQYGWLNPVIGDPRIYGRVYVGTNGRGILYGDIQQ
jgi:xyloglucan-specific exo-beta-1,4-glucanase